VALDELQPSHHCPSSTDLYQGGALDLLEGGKSNYAGWRANSPAEVSECNCVCLSLCAGKNRTYYSIVTYY